MNDISIGIVTFRQRKEYITSLIEKLKNEIPEDVDILLAINGNNDELMPEHYRIDMLNLAASYKNVYPIFCPEFKSLPKLWNTLVIFSRTKFCFLLSDDVAWNNSNAFSEIQNYIEKTHALFFVINNSFAHFVISKNMLDALGYFDERLLGFGWEDMDIIYRYRERFKTEIPQLKISGIANIANYDIRNEKIEVVVDNKPKFNHEFTKVKYVNDPSGICVMSPDPIKRIIKDSKQYPYESFVMRNKHNLQKYNKICILESEKNDWSISG